MRIVVDHVMNNGVVVADICAHTERAAWNKITTQLVPLVQVDFIDFVSTLMVTPVQAIGTGLEAVSNHALYPGKTRLQVLAAEIVRLNDAAARAVLGI